MKQMPWTERRFPHDLPDPVLPGIIERLRGTPCRLEERLRDLDPKLLVARDRDSWSIQENAGHLLQVETLWHGRLDDFAGAVETLRAADMENRETKRADYNREALASILDRFRDSRRRLVSRIEALDPPARQRQALHPRLGVPMRVVDLMFFAAEHDDYHLARITELIRILRP